jgi:hypothetical protein
MNNQERHTPWHGLKFVFHQDDGSVLIKDDVIDDNPKTITLSKEKYEILTRIQGQRTIWVEVAQELTED